MDSQPLTKPIVLVVDDEEDILFYFASYFRRNQLAVIGASNGLEALECMKAEPPSLLLSDIRMPGLDGLGLIRLIRQNETAARADIPAIALTAYADSTVVDAALSAGFNACVFKPFDGPQVLAIVRRFLAGQGHT